ncbi:hypothetical protein BDW74DRAFT_180192 [Aspergillus multicolor]|uniref:uncharacterized protein n=1 Tax=Aspergillus multicolor TaxID=41759 RepID=UPI003CCE17C9
MSRWREICICGIRYSMMHRGVSIKGELRQKVEAVYEGVVNACLDAALFSDELVEESHDRNSKARHICLLEKGLEQQAILAPTKTISPISPNTATSTITPVRIQSVELALSRQIRAAKKPETSRAKTLAATWGAWSNAAASKATIETKFAPPLKVHIGATGSGDTVMKSGLHRDDIAKQHGLIAFVPATSFRLSLSRAYATTLIAISTSTGRDTLLSLPQRV